MKILLLCVHLTLIFSVLSSKNDKNLQFHFNRFALYKQNNNPICYGVNFDAGSSGTRVYVYKWSCRRTQQAPDLDITSESPNLRKTPGISSFIENLNGIPHYFNSLMVFVNNIVPSTQREYVPIYLRATAGMRLLTISQQNAILKATRDYFKSTGYLFMSDDWFRVITGDEEGIYGFLSVNYLLGNVNKTVSPMSTRLVMDLGGASTQITYIPAKIPPQNNFSLVIPGYPVYNTYTYSFLLFGNDAAKNSTIFKIPTNGSQVPFPCFFSGYSEPRSDHQFQVIGTSDYQACVNIVRRNFNVCFSGDRTINGIYLAPIPSSISLHGIGVFTSIGQTLGNFDSYNIKFLKQKAQELCSQNWAFIQSQFPSNPFANAICFQLVYINELTTFAYKIDESKTIDVRGKIGAVTSSWTLGAMLVDIGNLKCSENTGELCNSSSEIILSILSMIITLISFML